MEMKSEMKMEMSHNFYENIAPFILHNEFFKKLLSIQLFINATAGEKFHILAIGDVAAGKSIIANEIKNIASLSSYCGKKTTPVGILENLIGTDGGILCVDEFDKIDKQVREHLLESMQLGFVTQSKYKSHITQKARVCILALCNPNNYVLNLDIPLIHQVRFGLPILTRFHAIIGIKQIDSSYYQRIAESFNLYRDPEVEEKRQMQMREHVIRTKEKFPVIELNNTFAKKIGDYVQYLKKNSVVKDIVSPRTIEGMMSACKANARCNKRNNVIKEDYEYVRDIYDRLYMLKRWD